MLTLRADRLRQMSALMFVAAGADKDDAKEVSQIIVDNCLYGHDSHGMACVPRFIEDIETGKIQPDAKPTVDSEHDRSTVLFGPEFRRVRDL